MKEHPFSHVQMKVKSCSRCGVVFKDGDRVLHAIARKYPKYYCYGCALVLNIV